MAELRRDPIIGRWVIVSTERGKRPADFPPEKLTGSGKSCPFCYGNEKMTPSEILAFHDGARGKDEQGWRLRVVPNKYPALSIEGNLNRHGDGMYDRMNGLGAHEVIIESPDHFKEMHELPDRQVEDILWAYRERISDLKRDMRLEYVLVFKNRGAAAGASLAHPHSQLIATPVVPKRVREEIIGAKQYFDYKERCPFCDMIRQEMATGSRVVMENEHFIAFCPFASRFPFEIWVLPKEHQTAYEEIPRHVAASLAQIMKTVLGKLNLVLENPPYNFLIHNSPLREYRLPHYHWHIEIMPKLTKVAGFEWGTGFYINPTPPEDAAKFLREYE
jgi:UDPglucose--hexose-1-phosphate uridylyltransferase